MALLRRFKNGTKSLLRRAGKGASYAIGSASKLARKGSRAIAKFDKHTGGLGSAAIGAFVPGGSLVMDGLNEVGSTTPGSVKKQAADFARKKTDNAIKMGHEAVDRKATRTLNFGSI